MFSASQTQADGDLLPSSLPSAVFEESIWIMAKQANVIKIPQLTSAAMEVIHPLFSFSWFCFIKSVLDQHFCKCLLHTCPYGE